ANQKSGKSKGKLKFKYRDIEAVQQIPADSVDAEILEIFLGEAGELYNELDESLNAWRDDTANTEHVEQLKRVLHTLKGGARMAGLEQLGEMSHELESDIMLLESQLDSVSSEVFDYLFRHEDNINEAIEVAQEALSGETADAVTEEFVEPQAETPQEALEAKKPQDEPQEEKPEKQKLELPITQIAPVSRMTPPSEDAFGAPEPAAMPTIERKSGSQETIRVSAAVLENLVNLAGESTILRGQVEQQIGGFNYSLSEIESTIRRLQGQVRLLGIETEAQITWRKEQIEASSTDDEFDPLEMDRYSQLQQLSRSLLESTSDLLDLKNTLVNVTRDTESRLLEQSRIQSDLQESLMRARMVPFSTIIPRLRRIVRQVSEELGKQVNLNFTNQEGEMDRSVLEAMVAPLEHMIRNAIDHGIESASERKKLGKPELGTITIGLARRGGEVWIRVRDDGRGLNIPAIKKRAIERNLLDPKAELTDHEISQFVFHSGFSTSENVTKISGRGVGMDVVYSEVRQLGGTVALDSEAGKGAEFNVRLPFTVSVNRALMVGLREDLYALPLNSIDGVVNITPAQLEHYYRHPDQKLVYAGQEYTVTYLGALLQTGVRPTLDTEQRHPSLVLVHSERGLYAVHVDSLLTSQEVVVKSLGKQFSTVSGLAGATILSDGRVVVILDLMELIRTFNWSHAEIKLDDGSEDQKVEDSGIQTVMVVDDSVTVRKVTGRFLEREGFRVITATDGVEALQLLQDEHPDVMLLDIEMPRMDGFEVAQRIKTTARWKDIPIIMITSRTGDKHRDRAMSLGVERYVGKPYQEETLMENILELICITAG
ncbi:MAG: hybrid sensor histidine kinase/response regulator, partial [bacterium]